jgi:hypothetical protein
VSLVLHKLLVLELLLVLVIGWQLSRLLGGLGGLFLLGRPSLSRGLLELFLMNGRVAISGLGFSSLHLGGCVVTSGGWLLLIVSVV